DGKEAKLADVPKGANATYTPAGKEGELSEVRVTGSSVTGTVAKVDASSLTLDIPGKTGNTTKALKLTADTKLLTAEGKGAKPADLKPGDVKAGDRVLVSLTADESAALLISFAKPDGEKAPGKFGGKVVSVDPAARTITLTGKGE